MSRYIIGTDVGGTSVKLGIFEEEGKLVLKWAIPTDISSDGENIIFDISESINEKLFELCIDPSVVIGIGMGVPGPVKKDGTVEKCPNIGWINYDAAGRLERLCNIKTYVLNDANSAALGEVWQGAAKGCENAVMITLGTGIGGGIVSDGKIITGSHGGGGEIGHMLLNPAESERCGCGKCGCFEQYASASGIVRLAEKRLADGRKSLLEEYENITAKAVFDAARSGDEVANETVNEAAEYMGRGLSAIACVTDPEVFIIGGGVSAAGEFLLDKIKEFYYPVAFTPQKRADFVTAKLGNDAGIYGAARYALGFSVSENTGKNTDADTVIISKEDVLKRLSGISEECEKAACGVRALLLNEEGKGDISEKITELKNNPVVKGAVFGDVNILKNDDVIAFTMEKHGQSLVAIGNMTKNDTIYSLPGQLLYIWLNNKKRVEITDNTVRLLPYQFVILEFYPGDELPG